jgi:hypothetical protein
MKRRFAAGILMYRVFRGIVWKNAQYSVKLHVFPLIVYLFERTMLYKVIFCGVVWGKQ